MFCKYCGNKIDDDSLFCNKCGEKITEKNPEYTGIVGEKANRDRTLKIINCILPLVSILFLFLPFVSAPLFGGHIYYTLAEDTLGTAILIFLAIIMMISANHDLYPIVIAFAIFEILLVGILDSMYFEKIADGTVNIGIAMILFNLYSAFLLIYYLEYVRIHCKIKKIKMIVKIEMNILAILFLGILTIVGIAYGKYWNRIVNWEISYNPMLSNYVGEYEGTTKKSNTLQLDYSSNDEKYMINIVIDDKNIKGLLCPDQTEKTGYVIYALWTDEYHVEVEYDYEECLFCIHLFDQEGKVDTYIREDKEHLF